MSLAVLILLSFFSFHLCVAQFRQYPLSFGMMTGNGFANQGMYNGLPQGYGQQNRLNGVQTMYNPSFDQNMPQMPMNLQYGLAYQQQPPSNLNGNMNGMGMAGGFGSAQPFAPSPFYNQGNNNMNSYGQQSFGYINQGGDSLGQFQGDSNQNSVPREENKSVSGATRVIPPFLKTASKAELDKFYQIVQHPTWNAGEKQEKIEEFVRGLEVDAQNLYAEFQRSSQGTSTARKRQVHAVVNSMSTEAQAQFQKVSALMTNSALTDSERLQKIQEVYDKIPANIKKEFDSKFTDL